MSTNEWSFESRDSADICSCGKYINRIFQGRIPYRVKLRLTSGGNVEELSDPENILRFRVTPK